MKAVLKIDNGETRPEDFDNQNKWARGTLHIEQIWFANINIDFF